MSDFFFVTMFQKLSAADVSTLSHIQQICSRWLWKYLWKKLYKCRYDNRKKLKTLCQKQKLLLLAQCFPKPSSAEALQSIYMRKGLILFLFLTGYYCVENATVNAPTGNICPAGSYCPTGYPFNIFCPNLTYTNHTGASICYTCRAGFSCTKKDREYACLMGHYCPEGTGADVQPCPAGNFGPTPGLLQV